MLHIYKLSNCQRCERRQERHNELATVLNKKGIKVQGVLIGKVNGVVYVPISHHDRLCRSAKNPGNYSAPCYIYEDKRLIAKLPDFTPSYSADAYSEEITRLIDENS